MKKIYILLASIAILVGGFGCSGYLDDPKPTDVLTAQDIYGSNEGVQAYFSGIYRMFRSQYSDGNTHFGGVYSMYYARSVKANDLISGPTWFLYDYAHTYRTPSKMRVTITWQYFYELINHANTIVKEVTASSAIAEADKPAFIAEAKALRAFAYFQLYLEYYSKDSGLQTPPLYKEQVTEAGPMSNPAEYEAFMIQDINEAIAGLTDSRINKSYMNKSVAQGLKARILMALNQDWDQVEAAASAAYGGDAVAALDGASIYATGFDDMGSDEVLWSMDQQADQSNYYYIAPHAFADHNQNAYFGMFCNNTFVNEFSATDVRNEFWNGYGVPATDYRQYITDKFVFAFDSDMHLMRKAEMVLIDAEAKYRNGKVADAHTLLYALQLDRDPSAVKSANAGAALLEEILLERRKELYAELGVEWFDAKRLVRGITRDGNHRVDITLEPNDKRFFLTVPQAEIDANVLIDDTVNDNR
ncbi:RagB/SusD family nutrient uptake outer membrane protein [Ancylomarina sp. YFZ004]